MTKTALKPTRVNAHKPPTVEDVSVNKWWEKTVTPPTPQKNKVLQTINFNLGSFDDEARTFTAIASTSVVDRQGDVIEQDGWDVDNFINNPVIPWAHDYWQPPVARATEIGVVDGKLQFTYQAPPKGMYEFADVIWDFYRNGFMFAFSVGFLPQESEGNTFTKCELLEISAVVVPANPQALALAAKLGVIDKQQTKLLINKLNTTVKNLEELITLEDESEAEPTSQDSETKSADESVSEIVRKEIAAAMSELKEALGVSEKGAISSDLPLADKDTSWDSGKAIAAIKDYASNADGDIDFTKYKKAFMYCADGGGDKQGDYKLPFATVVDGKLVAVWNAVKAIMAVLNGGRGGVDIPAADKSAVYTQVKKYYSKFDETPPPLDGKSLTDIQSKSHNENMGDIKAVQMTKAKAEKVKAVCDALHDMADTLAMHSDALDGHAVTMKAHAKMIATKASALNDHADYLLKNLLTPVNQGDETSEDETDDSTYDRSDDDNDGNDNPSGKPTNAIEDEQHPNNDLTRLSAKPSKTKDATDDSGEVNSEEEVPAEGADQEKSEEAPVDEAKEEEKVEETPATEETPAKEETPAEEEPAKEEPATEEPSLAEDTEVDPDNLTEEQAKYLIDKVNEKLATAKKK